ncbi:hypothetical protein KCP70_19200 [Salmonella enterica subsp. enterica]|nr:hypothetical protein KCP70_19200 [Salmonella enterica subsp. enterica]
MYERTFMGGIEDAEQLAYSRFRRNSLNSAPAAQGKSQLRPQGMPIPFCFLPPIASHGLAGYHWWTAGFSVEGTPGR